MLSVTKEYKNCLRDSVVFKLFCLTLYTNLFPLHATWFCEGYVGHDQKHAKKIEICHHRGEKMLGEFWICAQHTGHLFKKKGREMKTGNRRY